MFFGLTKFRVSFDKGCFKGGFFLCIITKRRCVEGAGTCGSRGTNLVFRQEQHETCMHWLHTARATIFLSRVALAGPLVRNLDTKYLSVRPASKVVLNTVIECLKGEWRVGQRKGSGPPSCSAMNKCKAIHRICDSESAEIR